MRLRLGSNEPKDRTLRVVPMCGIQWLKGLWEVISGNSGDGVNE